MKEKGRGISRREFVGAGAALGASLATATVTKTAHGAIKSDMSNHVKYRPHRKSRYPWWVKTVDSMTTETDESITVRPDINILFLRIMTETEALMKEYRKGALKDIEEIKNNVPGNSLRDFALQFACGTFFREGVSDLRQSRRLVL